MPLVYRRVRSVMGACVLRAWRAFSKRCSAHGALARLANVLFSSCQRDSARITRRGSVFGHRCRIVNYRALLPRTAAAPLVFAPLYTRYAMVYAISTRLVRPREWCTESVQRARYRLRTGTPKRRSQLPTATLYSTATSATVRPPPPIAESASGIMPRWYRTSNNMW